MEKSSYKKKEGELWRKLKKVAENSPRPPSSCSLFPNSKLIGYGWEWAAYELPNKKEVIKVPAGIFKEVNELAYLENTKYAYEVCKKYLKDFVVKTTFERNKSESYEINVLKQRKINGKEIMLINPQEINSHLAKQLSIMAKGMLAILKEYEWMLDLYLEPKKNGWNIWNLMIENNKPILFDFTAYYDVWRLYPQRTQEEKKIKRKYWQDFLKEVSR